MEENLTIMMTITAYSKCWIFVYSKIIGRNQEATINEKLQYIKYRKAGNLNVKRYHVFCY